MLVVFMVLQIVTESAGSILVLSRMLCFFLQSIMNVYVRGFVASYWSVAARSMLVILCMFRLYSLCFLCDTKRSMLERVKLVLHLAAQSTGSILAVFILFVFLQL
jgi:hypothetical protein